MSASFKMPPVKKGQMVLWYPAGIRKEDAAAAVVTNVGHDTVCLALVVKDCPTLQPRDGVRHMTDPALTKADVQENGGWDYTDETRENQLLQRVVQEMQVVLKDLFEGPKEKVA